MNKKLISFAVLLVSFSCYSQTFRPDAGTVSTSTVSPAQLLDTVVATTLTKKQVYSNALRYISTAFKDSRDVIEMKDPDLGEIIFAGNVKENYLKISEDKKGKKSTFNDVVKLSFKGRIYIKDDRFKIVLSGLQYDFTSLLPGAPQMTVTYPKEFGLYSGRNNAAVDAALKLIKDISLALNSKPENDF